jgi:hypothetical protein
MHFPSVICCARKGHAKGKKDIPMRQYMKRIAHAAVLATIGWYLLVPPVTRVDGKIVVDANAPLSNWLVYDVSAGGRECSRELERYLRKQEIDPIKKRQNYFIRCIPADDPRLKEK